MREYVGKQSAEYFPDEPSWVIILAGISVIISIGTIGVLFLYYGLYV